MKKIIVGVDNFAQSGEATLAEIAAQAQSQGGSAADVVRDPSTGKVIQVNVNLPDTASQVAIDAISGNKGVAASLVFPTDVINENFDALSVGAVPVAGAGSSYFFDTGIGAAADFSVSAPNSLKMPIVAGAGTQLARFFNGLSPLVQGGRTVEEEIKIRFSADSGIELFMGASGSPMLFIDSGDLRAFSVTGTIIESGLAINTFHTIKVRQVVKSDTMDVTVNGVSKGSFSSASLLNQSHRGINVVTLKSIDVWLDDVKITAIA